MNMDTEREDCGVMNVKKYLKRGNEFENIGKSNNLFKKNTCEARKLVLQIKEKPNVEKYQVIYSRQHSLTDSEYSQDSPPLSSGVEKRITYWSIQRGNYK